MQSEWIDRDFSSPNYLLRDPNGQLYINRTCNELVISHFIGVKNKMRFGLLKYWI